MDWKNLIKVNINEIILEKKSGKLHSYGIDNILIILNCNVQQILILELMR